MFCNISSPYNVGENVLESNQQMQTMTKAMDEISAFSGQIGKIIKAIEDMAFQTNINAFCFGE